MLDEILQKFKEWFSLKIRLWDKSDHVVFKQGGMWWCSLGMNLGEEIFGKGIRFTRPVLIFPKFTSNSFLGLPLTTQEKTGTWYVEIQTPGQKRWAMLNQARVLDKKRLTNRIGSVSKEDYKKVKERFLDFYNT